MIKKIVFDIEELDNYSPELIKRIIKQQKEELDEKVQTQDGTGILNTVQGLETPLPSYSPEILTQPIYTENVQGLPTQQGVDSQSDNDSPSQIKFKKLPVDKPVKPKKVKKPIEWGYLIVKLLKYLGTFITISAVLFVLLLFATPLKLTSDIVYSILVSFVFTLLIGFIFFRDKIQKKSDIQYNNLELGDSKYCKKCNYKLKKGKIIYENDSMTQVIKCTNTNCDFAQKVKLPNA